MKNNKKDSAHALTARFLNGDKNVTIRDIEKQEYIERFEYLWDAWSFKKSFLKPIVFFPVLFYALFVD